MAKTKITSEDVKFSVEPFCRNCYYLPSSRPIVNLDGVDYCLDCALASCEMDEDELKRVNLEEINHKIAYHEDELNALYNMRNELRR